ncbi:glycosyl hydrolases family 31-domain-containing protein [Talaromyces proteolyticus]|uniref:alpha-glucosidase n=1 Tax=Talaromyces proteolyticus TaxID=1131652 RepID=A0AAD4KU31_9EURO|nr:glycosyl hydrolases family 31-domain-containing protein [Talaromyces proteolyticus]KAH8697105.1 glycosyl hydrolases family 31-domain-containing protein [Talaromyces proteolyticus]
MPQREFVPKKYERHSSGDASSVHLRSIDGKQSFNFSFEAVRPNLFRVRFSSPEHPLPPYPSVSNPEAQLGDGATSSLSTTDNHSSSKIEIGNVVAIVDWKNTPEVSLSWTGSDKHLHRDLSGRSYVVDGSGVTHYSVHDRDALHVGLGEKAAPMDLSNRHFILSASDTFGYDVYRTDPLYKHIPLLIKASAEGVVAIFSTSHSRGTWSVGSELDGLYGAYKVYRQDYGGLEEYFIVGRTLKDVVRSYAELAGFPLLPPRWAFGYISGGYRYTMTDSPPANQVLLDFAATLKQHGIPCSAHQMSSGYSFSDATPSLRTVFTWHPKRFPDPKKWTAQMHAAGMRLLTNIKPFVLSSHPDFDKLKTASALFVDPETNEPGYMAVWSAGGGMGGEGCHIDFSSEFGFKWWYDGVQKLANAGVDGIWNDNNEYTLPHDDWVLKLDNKDTLLSDRSGNNVPASLGLWGRNMHTELMGKASHDALVDLRPTLRPFVLTRSATAGTLRYAASSWSGDDVTSWENLRGANALSLNAGMSLLHCYGHDIGGFEGPQPSPELLLRWVQLGIYSPRFAINCFKTSPSDNLLGDVIEPWMYPEITPLIRDAIKRRYEILPYIYSLALESHRAASPPQRWIGWGYEADPEVWSKKLKQGEEQFWFGDSLLIGGVYEPGVSVARVYLPRKSAVDGVDGEEGGFDYGYVNLTEPYQYLASGQWVEITAEWKKSIPILARIGGAVPVGKSVVTRTPGEEKVDEAAANLEEDDYRGVEVFPPRGSSRGQVFRNTWYEDDGISRTAKVSSFTLAYSSTEEKVTVGLARGADNGYTPAWKNLDIILPNGDHRHVVSDLGKPLEYEGVDSRGRSVYKLVT